MKLKYDKTWFEESAEMEGDSEIGAGYPDAFQTLVFGYGQVGQSMMGHAYVDATHFPVMDEDELYHKINHHVFPNDIFIINTIAATDWKWCEKNKEESDFINVTFPKTLARYAKENNLKFLHISSGAIYKPHYDVFEPYSEEDELFYDAPRLYTRQKIQAEEEIVNSGCQYTILRPHLIYSEHLELKSNALYKFLTYPKIYNSFQSMTGVDLLVEAINLLKHKQGIYNVAYPEVVSLEEIMRVMGIDKEVISSFDSSHILDTTKHSKQRPITTFSRDLLTSVAETYDAGNNPK